MKAMPPKFEKITQEIVFRLLSKAKAKQPARDLSILILIRSGEKTGSQRVQVKPLSQKSLVTLNRCDAVWRKKRKKLEGNSLNLS